MKITEIKINNLFELYNYNIKINNNKLIIVAENGGGKTTILKIIYYFLSKKWYSLSKYSFDNISVTIDNNTYTFDNTIKSRKTDKKIIEEIASSSYLKNDLLKIFFEDYNFDELKNDPFSIEKIEMKNEWATGQLQRIIDEIIDKSEPDNYYPDIPEIPILYLPTYRRTENDFIRIFSNLNKFTSGFLLNNFTEIGDSLIDSEYTLDELKNSKEFEEEKEIEIEERNLKAKNEVIDNFFSNLWAEFVKIRKKDKDLTIDFAEFGMQDTIDVINSYLQNNINTHDNIYLFCKEINEYLINKKIIFDKTTNSLRIELNNKKKILLSQLSSGEKQIISIFVYLYLTEYKYFVIIDEPEISISLRWQENLLSSIEKKAGGIFVATHSGTILKNHKQFARSINQFKIN